MNNDLISRQAAIDALRLYEDDDDINIDEVIATVAHLPSAQPSVLDLVEYCNRRNLIVITRELFETLKLYAPSDFISRNDIMQFPSVQPERQWIPCSERLPEQKGIYPVWTAKGFGDHLSASYWDGEGWTLRVIAWMPLPEPYREDEA